MRFFKKVAGFLGFGKEDDSTNSNTNNDDNVNKNDHTLDDNNSNVDPVQMGQRKGFSVPVKVAVERPFVGPILMPCNGNGGIQGFRWYADRMRVDEDGDVADEFLHEVPLPPDLSHHNITMHDPSKRMPRFQVKNYERRPKIIDLKVTPDGKFHHLVEFHGWQ